MIYHCLQCAGFFEQVACTGYDLQQLFVGQRRQRLPVEFDDLMILALLRGQKIDQQRGKPPFVQFVPTWVLRGL